MKITGERNYDSIGIYFDGILHLQILIDNHDGVQSWREGKGHYMIQLYRKIGKPIKLGYNTYEKWSKVLKLIDELL